ncbi:hypothetical protein EBU71_02585 [bacterium]|nr:hypothetical protein [Candidatus Elulimicrobium humile]
MSQNYPNRRFVIFDLMEVDLIDFSQVHETSKETLRLSVDGTKSFVKYEIPQPSSVSLLTTKSEEYTYTQILEILGGPEWTQEMPG